VYMAVAYSRTAIIFRRVRGRRVQAKLNRAQLITIGQVYCSLLVTLALLIVPFISQGGNVMVLLLGLQGLLFWICGLRWFNKLLRLGSRIIDPKRKQANTSSDGANTPDHPNAVDELAKSDSILKILISIATIIITIQAFFYCILAMVFPTNRIWLLTGVGLQSLLVLLSALMFTHQYQRCKNTILEANSKVRAITTANSNSTLAVVRKFTMHQIILLATALPGIIVLLLYSLEVIPVNFTLTIVYTFFDVVTNASLLGVFMCKGKRPVRTTGTEDETANGSNKRNAGGLVTERSVYNNGGERTSFVSMTRDPESPNDAMAAPAE
jgi:hypothetical protein